MSSKGALIFGAFLFIASLCLGWILGASAVHIKEMDRTVVVKGLAEKEVAADVVIWPLSFSVADNDLNALYEHIEKNTQTIQTYLKDHELDGADVSLSAPRIVDRLAQAYGGGQQGQFRYTASRTITVYSRDIEKVRKGLNNIVKLGKEGIVLSGDDYRNAVEYLYTGLNDIKPAMVEEATRNARDVAEKFARDSQSVLGKIRSARQGQFSISDRDKNNPHIKKVRVVSTIEYYLSD